MIIIEILGALLEKIFHIQVILEAKASMWVNVRFMYTKADRMRQQSGKNKKKVTSMVKFCTKVCRIRMHNKIRKNKSYPFNL